MIRFTLTDEQEKRYEEWIKNKHSFCGVIGGEVTFQFTPTSIGMIQKVVFLGGTKEDHVLDLTDYKDW